MGAGGRGEMGRRLGVEPAAQIPGYQRGDRVRQLLCGNLSSCSFVEQQWLQPFGRVARQAFVGQIGPFLSLCAAQEPHAVAPLQRHFAPRQTIETEADKTLREDVRSCLLYTSDAADEEDS